MFVFNLFAIMRGRLKKAPFECSVEAGRVLVSDSMRNLFDAQVAVCEEMGSSPESLFAQPLTETNTRLLFEKALQVAWAEAKFGGQITNHKIVDGIKCPLRDARNGK